MTISIPTMAKHGAGPVLACASAILALSLGIRHSFGLFLRPVTMDPAWGDGGREAFAFAIAAQNLVWGVAQPFAGMLADRLGAGRVIVAGTLLYALGLLVMAVNAGEIGFILGAGVLVGLGLSGTTYPLVLGALSRATPADRRSLALGLAMGGAAFGQFVMLPGALFGIDLLGWPTTFLTMAILSCAMIPLAVPLLERPSGVPGGSPSAPSPGPSPVAVIRAALSHRGFVLLALGFFVCGFQVVFIATHLPAFLIDEGLDAATGSTVLALIGLFNIAGTYYAGSWGARMAKPRLLTALYLGRAVIIAAFALLPVTQAGAWAFGAAMGLLWLSTVPLTNGTIATVFGVRDMSMLGGVVFLAHQIGGFLGGWIGGFAYDLWGGYGNAWVIAVGLSLLAALLNLPIREVAAEPVATPRPRLVT